MTASRPCPTGRAVRRRAAALAVATLTALAAVGLTAAPASATSASETAYLRPAHLIPELGAMDIRLSPFSGEGGDTAPEEQPVLETTAAYGSVGAYGDFPAGSYAVSVRPAGTPVSEPPLLSLTLDIEAGEAYTVAGLGTKDDPRLQVLEDDLTPPGDGSANVRVVAASLAAPTVDVEAVSGAILGTDIALGTATDYTNVPAGPWTLRAQGEDVEGSTELVLDSGTVYTLLVLDDTAQEDALRVVPVVDAVGTGATPAGGAETGSALTAPGALQPTWVAAGLLMMVLGALALAVPARLRAR